MNEPYIAVSFSGGKDSTAMLLHMIELGEQIDEVITADTGLEFPQMYDHINKVFQVLDAKGIKHTTLRSEISFEEYLLRRPVESKKWGTHTGYGWASMKSRWCTKHLKTELIDRYFRDLRKSHRVVQCIGLASDETKRLDRPNNQRSNHRHPLVEWGWTEKDCLSYCYEQGYDWDGLYEKFTRVSCWCCPLQSIPDLRSLYNNFPDLWEQLTVWDDQVKESGNKYLFREKYGARDLGRRFELENHRKSIGVNTNSKNFYKEIRRKPLPESQKTFSVGGEL